ncbi:YdcF family protein [Paenibacillus sp. PsM32]|uniref:YdcF family protein n=1 Tax=Paenibacillus sp. PsM32 TaxID=3030536 RepID=UPI00263A82C4|nr:YdcF family protein [Paenibacillus sp. PsM32]MDN4618389.1 YdcF family protein [Paenibacillus sp. PsM32]
MLTRLKKIGSHDIFKRMIVTVIFVVVLSFAIIKSMIISGFKINDTQASHVDYIIILGSGLKGSQLSIILQQRVDTGIVYLKQHPHMPVIVSGGQGPGEDIPEAEAMSRYLVSQGIDQTRIIQENRSTSTFENLKFSQDILQARGIHQPSIMIVTSNYHLYRAEMIASTLGFKVHGIASPSLGYLLPQNMLREYLAMIKAMLQLP